MIIAAPAACLVFSEHIILELWMISRHPAENSTPNKRKGRFRIDSEAAFFMREKQKLQDSQQR